MNKTHLTITTPTKKFFEKDVEIVTLKTTEGYIGLQANASPFFSNVEMGTIDINFQKSENHQKFLIGSGLVYADATKVNIITDDIIKFEDIDIERAQRDKEKAEQELAKATKSSLEDIRNIELKLKKALLKIDSYNQFIKK
ncbi:ATP synthase F1 subunit epsilon [Mycoplasma sp. Ms02]|uniref:ATP synthase F1 subunit epsilon n=1 Tax=Mycoplasma sp. Ms02 TaxID=353851 RepID=UPI001C88F976|nr:ATP synthase F1 subunit epsilon [Mycoplasma sp. Ms02]QZE12431.1 ATP synthase F1 subunit epsilon [Mycoplasma sp. Ms02]